ncbi:MAG: hypothetical protein ACLQU2_17410 [Candidatus Binataceae bacterium]
MAEVKRFVGIDLSKAQLDVAIGANEGTRSIANDQHESENFWSGSHLNPTWARNSQISPSTPPAGVRIMRAGATTMPSGALQLSTTSR